MTLSMGRVAIGNRIKALLKQKKMTQSDLSSATGFTQSVISEMLSGKRNITPLIEKIVPIFGVSRDYIIAGEENNRCDIIASNDISPNGLTKEEHLRLVERIDSMYELHQQRIKEANDSIKAAGDIMKEIISITRLLVTDIETRKE